LLYANGSGQFGRPASIASAVANGTNGWRGSVVSDNGQIDTFRAPDGTISGFTAGTESPISAKTHIGWIQAESLNAEVRTLNPAGTGTISFLNVTNNGNFTGSYTTDYIGGNVNQAPGVPDGVAQLLVSGTLSANVTISKSVRNTPGSSINEIDVGTIASGSSIRIGEQLVSNGVIRIGNSAGLAGQIILNAANINPNTAWSGTLNVNNATLPEEYQTLSSTLGGGASGVVPFPVHTADSGVVFGGYTGINTLLQSDFEAAKTSSKRVDMACC
jgi:hypothetical protein